MRAPAWLQIRMVAVRGVASEHMWPRYLLATSRRHRNPLRQLFIGLQ